MIWKSLLIIFGTVAWIYGASATDTENLNSDLIQELLNEARVIANDSNTRNEKSPYLGNESETSLNPKIQALIGTYPILQEAYKTDPKATLDLIRRIIEASNN